MFASLFLLALAQSDSESVTVPSPVPMPTSGASTSMNLTRSCPATSLYVLLRLHDFDVSFEDVLERLGTDTTEGVPASVLCEVSKEFGLPLRVVQLREEDLDHISGAWIAFTQGCGSPSANRIGHFVVVRALANTTKLQVIDPPQPPVIGDREKAFQEHGWCRIALVPSERNRERDGASIVGAGIAGTFVSMLLLLAVRKTRLEHPSIPKAHAGPT